MQNANYQAMLLNLIERPAFCVESGKITQVNPSAQKMQITPDTQIDDLLGESKQAYHSLESGCLFLNLTIAGISCGATVTKADQADIFTLEASAEDMRLQALALAAQQLRVPLSNVMTVSDQLLTSVPQDENPGLRKQVGQINRGLFQLLRIISNMADAQRYSNPDSLRMEPGDFTAIFREIMEKASHLLADSGIRIHYAGPRHSVVGMVCSEALERAVYNLLSNAVKFSPKGSTLEIRLTEQDSMLHFCLQNDSPDISAFTLSNIFTRYQRQPGIEDGRHGIGLGMTLVRAVASAHGGTVLIDQPTGKGVRVTMTLAVRIDIRDIVRTPIPRFCDYAGGWDHALLELSEALTSEVYQDKI